MSAHRFMFFAPSATEGLTTLELTGEEHHHMRNVLRVRDGSQVFVTNGEGLVLDCCITDADRDTTYLDVNRIVRNAGSDQPLVLALGLLRKERFEQAVEQCAELGATEVLPFVADGCHLREYSEKFITRLNRICVAAMKQSFRSTLPFVSAPVEFSTLVERMASGPAWLAHGETDAAPASLPRPALVVVGPEAGLAEAEVSALIGAGGHPVNLSPHRLRAETAAVAACTAAGLV